MRDFFESKKFKIIILILALLFGLLIYAIANSSSGSPASVFSFITTPISKLSTFVSDGATSFFTRLANAKEYEQENKELRKEISELRKKLVDYEKTKEENIQLAEIAGLKKTMPQYEYVGASIVAKDASDLYSTFVVDKGSLNGVKVNDCVITSEGLVGKVDEVTPTSARISTILSPTVQVGAIEIRTKGIGVVCGDLNLADQGICKMMYLPRETGISTNDIVTTSGGGAIYPQGLIIGIVKLVEPDKTGKSAYAQITTAVDLENIKNVYIITNYKSEQ